MWNQSRRSPSYVPIAFKNQSQLLGGKYEIANGQRVRNQERNKKVWHTKEGNSIHKLVPNSTGFQYAVITYEIIRVCLFRSTFPRASMISLPLKYMKNTCLTGREVNMEHFWNITKIPGTNDLHEDDLLIDLGLSNQVAWRYLGWKDLWPLPANPLVTTWSDSWATDG